MRVRTPTVLQMEAVECGAACLAIILEHYGRYVPLARLRRECGVDRDGSKAGNVLRAARQHGLEARGQRCEVWDLRGQSLPFVVFWNFNHFLVVEGFGRGVVHVNDPASGPRTVTEEEFDASFTGVALFFQPGPDFRREGTRPSVAAGLRRRLEGAEGGLLFAVLCALFLVVPGLAVPAMVQVFVDQVLVMENPGWVVPVVGGLLLVSLLQFLLAWLQQHYLLRLETRLAMATSSRFLWHVLRLPLEFYAQRYCGEIGTRVALNDRVAALLSGQLATAALNLVMIGFFAVLMLLYDPLLTGIAVGVAALDLAGLRAVHRLRRDAWARVLQEEGKAVGQAMRGLMLMESMKGAGTEDDFFRNWAGLQARVVSARQQMGVYTQVLALLPVLLGGLATTAVLALGGVRVIQGEITMGMLVAFQFLMLSFLAPVNGLMGLANDLQETQGDLERLDDVLANPADPALERHEPGEAGLLTGRVELQRVTFGYSPLSKPLLQDVSIVVEPGQRVAIVGPVGSGKTTIARLLCGLYQPWSGAVLFDGRPRAEIPRRTLNASVATVSQEIFLFEGTVRDNLTLWDPTVPDADLVQACRDACVHEDVAGRPGGYHGPVAEGGANFSGGQRQRLEIARALVGKPSVLVLDEATSALDPLTEKEIDDRLRRRGCTCIIVAHRLSTIRDCDQILVMDQGKVVERGTHEELMQRGTLYPTLVEN